MPRTPIRTVLLLLAAPLLLAGCTPDDSSQTEMADAAATSEPALDYTVTTIDGREVNLAEAYDGDVVLIVNVASRCGFTRQYAGLQELHERYADEGLAVLGFPCNQFRNQEPGTNEEIMAFCQENYGVEFAMFDKIEVNGPGQAPLYAQLTDKSRNPHAPDNGKINWNFEKFLIGRDGRVLAHYRSQTSPTSKQMVAAIEAALRS
jgi:glutathione peroxidase